MVAVLMSPLCWATWWVKRDHAWSLTAVWLCFCCCRRRRRRRRLQGSTPTSRVVLTGTFFDWNPAGRVMTFQPPLPTSPMRDITGEPVGDASGMLIDDFAAKFPAGWFETHLRLAVGNHAFKCVVTHPLTHMRTNTQGTVCACCV